MVVSVLMLIKTSGLEYDDRLRKEALSLQELGCHVQIVALENANRSQQKVVYGNVPALTISLRSRNWFPRATGLLIKTLELYAKLLLQTLQRRPTVLWVHDLTILGLIPAFIVLRGFRIIDCLVWDQHELPGDRFLNHRAYMRLYQALANGCDAVIMANEQRRTLIRDRTHNRIRTPIKILHNYPDRIFQQLPRKNVPESVSTWLDDTSYVLAQGGANPGRRLDELTSAILLGCDFKVIVIGPYQQHQLAKLSDRHGQAWHEKVLFTGFVPQMEIIPYIDDAIASVIFYETSDSNSLLCAPNRLYQALARGTPVVVGPNPPMRQLVERYGCGVAVDHSDPVSILGGIEKIAAEQERYSDLAFASSRQMSWEQQDRVIESIIAYTQQNRGHPRE